MPITEFDARELLGDEGLVIIILDGERYMLRITSREKLILTKPTREEEAKFVGPD
ncbi:MAG: hypothetical protein CMH12_03445 [Maritimibacter sp.]|nr:hypothetical protein [Maritimibacter sp.]